MEGAELTIWFYQGIPKENKAGAAGVRGRGLSDRDGSIVVLLILMSGNGPDLDWSLDIRVRLLASPAAFLAFDFFGRGRNGQGIDCRSPSLGHDQTTKSSSTYQGSEVQSSLTTINARAQTRTLEISCRKGPFSFRYQRLQSQRSGTHGVT